MEKISGLELIPIKCQLMLSYAQASKSERDKRLGFRIQANHASSPCTLGFSESSLKTLKKFAVINVCNKRKFQKHVNGTDTKIMCQWKIDDTYLQVTN